ncbi:21293_t:CDS:2 [Cetraspora pellucida]|uniref:21293_t:CDS:1 n=1 Tax=Cetraspora pellucida TaxID=1433469 RepID=A0A9N9HBI1_9GLOM|nr:21293_t:CDS:2 [Cetraspora pellucida]
MEDLDDLIWGSNSTKPQSQKNNSTPLNAMRDEQLKLQEQEQRRKVHEDHQRITNHYSQTNFWDSLERKGSGSSSPLPQPSGDLFDDILTTSSSEFGSFETAQNNPLKNKSLLTQTTPAGNNSYNWNSSFLSNNTNSLKEINTSSSTADDLLDFGIFDKPPKSPSPITTTKVNEDKIDPFSIDDKPSIKNSKIISESPLQGLNIGQTPSDDSKDYLIAQIVEMGFSAAEAETALAAADDSEDIQSAIEILFQQREAENQLRKRQIDKRDTFKNKQDLEIGKRRTNILPHHDDDGDYDDDSEPRFTPRGRHPSKSSPFSVPRRNIYGKNASDGESSDRSSSSTSSFYQSKDKLISTASEFGLTALKKASALYKQSRDRVNKALVELQLQHDSEEEGTRRPRWMQENEFQESDDYSSEKYNSYGGKANDKHKRLQEIASSCDNTSSENLGSVNLNKFGNRNNDKYGRLEKFNDSYEDTTSSDEDQPVIDRDNFTPISSDFRKNDEVNRLSNFDLVDSKKSKPSKPAVPSRSTKPNIDFNNSSYVSPARRRPHTSSSSTMVGNVPTHHTPKIIPTPRPTIHVSPEQIRNSESHKTKGNDAFKLGQFGEAEKSYSLAIDCLPSKYIQLVVLYNNRATAKFKNGDQRGCAEDCTLALQLIGDYTLPPPREVNVDLKAQYIKALLRRASAYESMEKYVNAKDDYQKLMNIDPNNNKKVSDGLRRCQQAINMSTGGFEQVQKSSNSNGFDNDFMPFGTQTFTNPSTYVAQLNEFGFINPTMVKPDTSNITMETTVDPNNPAVVKLRSQTRQQEVEDAEKLRCKDQVDQKLMHWKGGKETNIRALISSLDTVLWEGLGWKTIGLHELVTPAQVKIKYIKAIGKVHPDKLSSSATIEQKLVANGVFSTLNYAWDVFKTQNNI